MFLKFPLHTFLVGSDKFVYSATKIRLMLQAEQNWTPGVPLISKLPLCDCKLIKEVRYGGARWQARVTSIPACLLWLCLYSESHSSAPCGFIRPQPHGTQTQLSVRFTKQGVDVTYRGQGVTGTNILSLSEQEHQQ